MAPVEEKPYFFSKDTNGTTSHIPYSRDLIVLGVSMKNSSFCRGRFISTRLHFYQNKRPNLCSDNSWFQLVSFSFHVGLNMTFSLMENGNLESVLLCRGWMNRISNVQYCDSNMGLLRLMSPLAQHWMSVAEMYCYSYHIQPKPDHYFTSPLEVK